MRQYTVTLLIDIEAENLPEATDAAQALAEEQEATHWFVEGKAPESTEQTSKSKDA